VYAEKQFGAWNQEQGTRNQGPEVEREHLVGRAIKERSDDRVWTQRRVRTYRGFETRRMVQSLTMADSGPIISFNYRSIA
jgi:hypothetical protein